MFKEFEKYLNIMALPENWGQAPWKQRQMLLHAAGQAEKAFRGTPQAWAFADFFEGTVRDAALRIGMGWLCGPQSWDGLVVRPSELGWAGGAALRIGMGWWCGPQSWFVNQATAGNKMPGTSIIPPIFFSCANFNSNDCNAAFFKIDCVFQRSGVAQRCTRPRHWRGGPGRADVIISGAVVSGFQVPNARHGMLRTMDAWSR
jgi:hypothetical protein